MKIDITNGNNHQKHKMRLSSEAILRYLIGNDDELDTLIMCKSSEIELVTYDLNVYEALASVKPYDNFRLNKLAKLFEVVDVQSYKERTGNNKPILVDARVEELRKLALKN